MAKPPAKRPRGRPSKFTRALAVEVCERLAKGENLLKICRDDHMPDHQTVRGWAVRNEGGDFQAMYAHAREMHLEYLADEIPNIADEQEEGSVVVEGPDGVTTTTKDMLEHRRLKIESRKWVLSKLAWRKYGDKPGSDVSDPDGKRVVKIIVSNDPDAT